ncbi:MAG TPA: nuclear transport factor 2 family protein [Pseudonocardia sp.]|jgi:limonene-1,2-epoxide hydrolase|nr:nuclear transport factor 2 family protein [Pseudonocardia sp.]
MSPTPLTLAHRFTGAFNARDVERLVDLFTPDATYHDLFYGTWTGHDGLRALFTRMYTEGSRHEWTMTAVAVAPGHTLGEWDFELTLSEVLPSGAGRTLRYAGVSVFETRDGRCHTYREHFDRAAALLGVGISPGAVARIVRRRPSVRVTLPSALITVPKSGTGALPEADSDSESGERAGSGTLSR